jgi:hypothetical protein
MGKIRVGNTNLAIYNGQVDLTEWTDEELTRGRRRDKNGRWVGRPPKVVPKAVHDELVRRKMSEAFEELREALLPAVRLLRQVVEDEEADYVHRVKASELIINRLMPKAPDRIQVEMAPQWALAIQALYESRGPLVLETTNVDDADIIEDDPEDF